ncbi:MAG: GEVED domain-containing protein [Salibacteraceae bacterium]
MPTRMIRLSTLSLVLTLCYFAGEAQEYKQMMDDHSVNVYDVIDAAEKYYQTHPKGKGSGWKNYQRWKHVNEANFFPSGDRSQIAPDHAWKAYYHFMANYQTGNFTEQENGGTAGAESRPWTELGPWAANNVTGSWSPGLGRVETFYIDPSDSNHIYLGSRSGGFWKTNDGGQTWNCTTDTLPVIGIPSLAVSPTSSDSIFIATRTNLSAYSIGLLQSSDGGDTWQTTNLSLDLVDDAFVCYKLAFHPTVPDLMYLGNNRGLYRSYDRFQTWDTLMVNKRVTDFEFKPGDPNVVYAYSSSGGDNNKVYISNDQGSNFLTTTITGLNIGGSELAVTAANADYVYLGTDDGIYRSTNGGISFTQMGAAPTNMMSFGVSDTDPDRILYGGLDSYVSVNGGASFFQVSDWTGVPGASDYIHADLREVESFNGTLYAATDGYLARSSDGGINWTLLSDGCAIREFYAIGGTPLDVAKIAGGSQDNGTSVYTSGTWYEWMGADGMRCSWSRSYHDIVFGTWQFGGLHISRDGGNSRNYIVPDDQSGNWITPFRLSPHHPNTIWVGYDTIYRSTDNGSNWEVMADLSNFGNADNLEISEREPDLMFVSDFQYLLRSKDGGTNFDLLNSGSGLPALYLSDIALDTERPEHLAVSYRTYNASNKVFVSTDTGNTWTNLTYDLPNLPVWTLVFDVTGKLYVGTDIGIYYLNPGATNWIPYIHNMPRGSVRELLIHKGSNRLQAGMWGRGLWEAPLPGRETHPAITYLDTDPGLSETNGPKSNDSVFVQATITDDGNVVEAWAEWSVNAPIFDHAIPMSVLSGTTFETDNAIPAQAENDVVYFRVWAVDNNNDTSCTDHVVYLIDRLHCAAAGSQGTGSDYITLVDLGDISNASGQDYYGDFSGISTQVELGESYPLTVALNTSFPVDRVLAWVDWNNDGIFSNSESVSMSIPNVSHTSTGTVTVPANLPLGPVRMRVRNVFSTTFNDPCGDAFGEVEDYTLIVTDGIVGIASLSASEDLGLSVFPNPLEEGILQWQVTASDATAGERIRVTLYDVQGREVLNDQVTLSQGQSIYRTALPAGLGVGSYVLIVQHVETRELMDREQVLLRY